MVHSESTPQAISGVRTRLLASLSGTVALTLALASFVRLPGRTLVARVLGSDVSYEFSGAAQYVLLLGAMVCVGVTVVHRVGQGARARRIIRMATYWGLPLLIAMGTLLSIDALSWWGYQIGAAILTGVFLAVVVHLQVRSTQEGRGSARLILNILVYVAALLLFLAIYDLRQRSIVSSTLVFISTLFLSAELFRDADSPAGHVWLWSAIIAMLLSEMLWGMNYTRLSTRAGGVLLLIAFYSLSGMVQQYLWGRLSRRAVIEFVLIAIAGLAVVLALS